MQVNNGNTNKKKTAFIYFYCTALWYFIYIVFNYKRTMKTCENRVYRVLLFAHGPVDHKQEGFRWDESGSELDCRYK